MSEISSTERRQMIRDTVNSYTMQGYSVVTQSDDYVKMQKAKKFNWVIFLIGLVIGVVPALIYVIVYMAQKNQAIFIRFNTSGELQVN